MKVLTGDEPGWNVTGHLSNPAMEFCHLEGSTLMLSLLQSPPRDNGVRGEVIVGAECVTMLST